MHALKFISSHRDKCRQYLIKAWELMYLCASCLPPSKDIGGYLSEYVHNVAHGVNIDSEVQNLALNTLNALKHSVKAGPRHKIPGREEIEALLTDKRLTTIVFFLDETFEEITYDMSTTVADAVEVLLNILLSFCMYILILIMERAYSKYIGKTKYGLDIGIKEKLNVTLSYGRSFILLDALTGTVGLNIKTLDASLDFDHSLKMPSWLWSLYSCGLLFCNLGNSTQATRTLVMMPHLKNHTVYRSSFLDLLN